MWKYTASPGSSAQARIGWRSGSPSITVALEPGRWSYVCWLRDGTNDERHAERGMIGEFTVG